MLQDTSPPRREGGLAWPSLPTPLDKPLDAGNGLVSASFARGGAWLSLGSAHSKLGYVELSGLPPFEESWRDDATAVRRYRFWMTEERFPFLQVAPQVRQPIEEESYGLVDGIHPFCRMVFERYSHEVTTWAAEGSPAIKQRHELRSTGAREPVRLLVRFRGEVNRPALGEITEAGVLEETRAVTALESVDGALTISATELPALAEIRVELNAEVCSAWRVQRGEASLLVEWDPLAAPEAHVDVTCSLREGQRPAGDRFLGPQDASLTLPGFDAPRSPLVMPDSVRAGFEWLTFRALSYTMRCTALVTAPSEICLVTDHRLLPLSWTRDAYYQALLLLSAGIGKGADAVGAHLRWLWARCQRVDGAWMRSHLPNGAVKDAGFQVDQQLYPMLELCDYWRMTGELPRLSGEGRRSARSEQWGKLIVEAWAAVPSGADLGFARTDESPADDPATLPYLLSSEILRWYTAVRLAEVQNALDLAPGLHFASAAEQLRASINEHFVFPGPYGPQWAYAIDGEGRSTLYNDANDLPTAFAPLWGFCEPSDERWRATMRFTFSRANNGYSPGRFGGLGSRHTPGTWPLGDIQEWVCWSLMGDPRRAQRPLTRLLIATTADGMLPETYDSTTGVLSARHWFAWPGALVGALFLAAVGARSPWFSRATTPRRARASASPGAARSARTDPTG